MKERMYILVAPDGRINTNFMSGWRKGVEVMWVNIWDGKTWKQFYYEGYRIKKCTLTIELEN